jgi:hypothetical protein
MLEMPGSEKYDELKKHRVESRTAFKVHATTARTVAPIPLVRVEIGPAVFDARRPIARRAWRADVGAGVVAYTRRREPTAEAPSAIPH